LLVAVCNHVAAVRELPLAATTTDIRSLREEESSFDLITCMSVLEHVVLEAREDVFASLFRLLQPGGLLYLTFDYGHYVARDDYRSASGSLDHESCSISDLSELCMSI